MQNPRYLQDRKGPLGMDWLNISKQGELIHKLAVLHNIEPEKGIYLLFKYEYIIHKIDFRGKVHILYSQSNVMKRNDQ